LTANISSLFIYNVKKPLTKIIIILFFALIIGWLILFPRSDDRLKSIALDEFYMYLGDNYVDPKKFVGPEEYNENPNETKFVWKLNYNNEILTINIFVPRYGNPPHYGAVDISLSGNWNPLFEKSFQDRQEEARKEFNKQ